MKEKIEREEEGERERQGIIGITLASSSHEQSIRLTGRRSFCARSFNTEETSHELSIRHSLPTSAQQAVRQNKEVKIYLCKI